MHRAAWTSLGLVRLAGLRWASLTARCFSAEIVAAVRTFVERRSDGADAGSVGSVNLTFLAVHMLRTSCNDSVQGQSCAVDVNMSQK
jgi:hypothetical protein